MKGIIINSSGLLTTIQDEGRFGYQQYGIPQSGYMDELAANQANYLVGNHQGTSLIECTYIPPMITFQKNFIIALTGANMYWTIDDFSVPRFTSLYVKKGSTLRGRASKHGVRAYIAIQGEILLDQVLGSRATFLAAKMGGRNGNRLNKGDIISFKQKRSKWDFRYISDDLRPNYEKKKNIIAQAGPEWYKLNQTTKYQLIKGIDCSISKDSDRMASRLDSLELKVKEEQSQFASKPVVPGMIQLPKNGKPIVILNDGQTIGGYPRIGFMDKKYLNQFNQIRINESFNLQIRPSLII